VPPPSAAVLLVPLPGWCRCWWRLDWWRLLVVLGGALWLLLAEGGLVGEGRCLAALVMQSS
jgi:hypothetical protein